MYALTGDVLDAARSLGATDVVTLAAYVGGVEGDVLGVASDLETAADLQKAGISLLRTGFIGGMNGLLVGLSPLYGLRGICLLGATSGEDPVDLEAAGNLLEVVNNLLGLGITREDMVLIEQEEPEDLSQERTEQEFDMTYR
jgi:proteasome assembly chaperone (PAC2) family protein